MNTIAGVTVLTEHLLCVGSCAVCVRAGTLRGVQGSPFTHEGIGTRQVRQLAQRHTTSCSQTQASPVPDCPAHGWAREGIIVRFSYFLLTSLLPYKETNTDCLVQANSVSLRQGGEGGEVSGCLPTPGAPKTEKNGRRSLSRTSLANFTFSWALAPRCPHYGPSNGQEVSSPETFSTTPAVTVILSMPLTLDSWALRSLPQQEVGLQCAVLRTVSKERQPRMC